MHTRHTTSSTIDLLAEFGPDAAAPASLPNPDEALAFCRRLARTHQENFPVLSRLVPPGLVDPFAAVYAFCRAADDLADEHAGTEEARGRAARLLAWWKDSTIAWHRGQAPAHPVFIALATACAQDGVPTIPLKPMLDLIDAFEQDQRVTRYDTWEQLIGYCSRSANPVGRLVLALGGVPDAGAAPDPEMPTARRRMLEQADDLCTALQLTNFWQDVRRDLLDRDRVYLPRALTGFDDATLRDFAHRSNDPAARVPYIRGLRPLVERTAELFDRSRDLHLLVPPAIAAPVWLFHRHGRATLAFIEAGGCTTLWSRPTLPKGSKAVLLARAIFSARRNARAHAMRHAAIPCPSPRANPP